MANDTTRLLGLDGLAVVGVADDTDGPVVHLVTADERACHCPDCGTRARRSKGRRVTRPRDLSVGGRRPRLVWAKRRWRCDELACRRRSFTESVPPVPPRKRLTTRLRAAAGAAVADQGRTVVQAARDYALSWSVVAAAFTSHARAVLPAQPEPVQALGIDEIRRGRPRWIPDEATGIWQTAVDRWHVGFVDLSGKRGLLGQVEGRTAQAVIDWLADRDQAWRDAVQYVAIDMCTIFKSAIRRVLPQATLVVDHFHLVQLANQTLTEVRRRVTVTHRGRRGRKGNVSGNCATGSPAPPPGCAASPDPPGPGTGPRSAVPVLPPVRRRRPSRTAAPSHNRRDMVARDPCVPAHRDHQRRLRRHQPGHQDHRPRRLRLPQPRQPALTHPLRDHPSSPWTPRCPLISLSPHPAIVLASGTELSVPQVSAWL